MSTATISGLHHVTAIAGDPQRNFDFYTQVLGLRLVKLTVNFDDPGTYHFYFGNARGTPGSILTFFPWRHVPRGSVGAGQVSATAFAAPLDSMDFWAARLTALGVPSRPIVTRFGEPVLTFADPDGMPAEIIGTALADPAAAWQHGVVPAEHAIGGFHSATLLQQTHEATAATLELMGFRLAATEGERRRYAASDGPAGIIDVVAAPDEPLGRLGTGTVHHIAFRTPADDQQRAWRQTLSGHGYGVSPIMDRSYFHSIYFREPGGVLFEIATDPPGFATDETPEQLGTRLMLPPWLEERRADIEQRLPVLDRMRA